MRKKKLIRDTVLLTGSTLSMRGISLLFQIWLVSRIGAAGVGLYGLVSSVNALAATFAISGIRFTTTRLISEELGLKRSGGVGRALRLCLLYSLFFGVAAALILYFCAEPIGFLWVGDARTVLSLKISAPALPFISMASVFYGYFTASGRIFKAAAVSVLEHIAQAGLVMLFLSAAAAGDLEKSCAAVSAGNTATEILSFFLMLGIFLADRKKHRSPPELSPRLPSRILSLAVPLALSAYARTSLATLEQLLVPRGLKKAGFSADKALSGYGTIQGMVFPIIFFPSCLLSALAELIVPELTALQVSGKSAEIRRNVRILLKKSFMFAAFIGLMLLLSADLLGKGIYKSPQAAGYIRLFALLVPVIYMDMVTDGCLKGLGQQVWSMGINILDALVGVVLVPILLPRFALGGYIFILFFEEILNLTLSLLRLRRAVNTAAEKAQTL